ncbi:hypothetical protein C7M84_002698 [Penaeus vannamei]|uniref:XK-related protein n=1 Tax=Penaeus vannamei TaxID=6689 RepID=A0A423TQ59_PENVA|nr:hypothetical protein C7M84_002698 [Penaeus vannamei]
MKAAPAPAGDPLPSRTPAPSAPPGAAPGGSAPPSNTASTDTTSTSGSGSEGGGRWAAAILLLTHVVELAAMGAAILTRSVPETPLEAEPWSAPFLPLQVTVAAAPLAVITAISLVWAVRAQDFSGRATARMLCWLLHVLQASILWRFLKVHLAFDPSDVAELGTLRFVQVHVHTLPFLVVHVAIILGGATAPGVASVLVAAAMVVSVVIAIVVSTTASHSSRPSWASVLVLVHWLGALVWLGLQEELEPTTLGPFRKILRRAFLAYLLLWDFHVFRDDASAMTVCARPRLPAAYYTITAIQNVAVTATWYSAGKATLPVIRTAAISSVLAAQAVALLLLALSYLYCSSLLPSWPRNKASALARTASLVTPCAKVAPPATPPADTPEHHDNGSYVDFKDVEDGVVPEVSKAKADPEDLREVVLTPVKSLPPIAHSTPRSPLPLAPRLMAAHLPPAMFSFSHDILPPRLAKSERSSTDNGSFNSRNTNTLPPQLPPEYDLLHRAHGSFSDSFSSLSCGTINRATTSARAMANQDPRSSRTPPPTAKVSFASHTSCRNGFCHCKLFDGIEGPCDVEEEEEEEEEESEQRREAQPDSSRADEAVECDVARQCHEYKTKIQASGVSHIFKAPPEVACESAPRVALVRGVQRFRVVCAACLHAHDPLLTSCLAHASPPEPPVLSGYQTTPLARSHAARGSLSRSCEGLGGGSSTDYPSDTEVTATADTLSSASADSHSTYTTWPVGRGPGMARLLQLHPGSHDYVTAWLRHQQARGRAPPTPAASGTP